MRIGIQLIHTSHKWQPEDEESEATSKQASGIQSVYIGQPPYEQGIEGNTQMESNRYAPGTTYRTPKQHRRFRRNNNRQGEEQVKPKIRTPSLRASDNLSYSKSKTNRMWFIHPAKTVPDDQLWRTQNDRTTCVRQGMQSNGRTTVRVHRVASSETNDSNQIGRHLR